MPEGDTIWRTAHTLHQALAGRAVTAFVSPLPLVAAAARRLNVVGRKVETVEARGKHLLVRFEGGPVLRTHQGMTGSWHLYRKGSPWTRRQPRVVLEAGEVVAVCFHAPVVELLSATAATHSPTLGRLGPDLLAPDFDPGEARRRLRLRGDLPIAVALLDQTALAGIGNVYESEVLFLEGLSPFAQVADLDDTTLDRVVAQAARQMRRNLGTGMRRTTSELAPSRLWVYRRSGRPCRRCGETIRRVVQGEAARSTYFCPRCQRAQASGQPPHARSHRPGGAALRPDQAGPRGGEE